MNTYNIYNNNIGVFFMKPFVQKTMISRIERTLELQRYRKHLEQIIREKTNEIESKRCIRRFGV